MKNQQKFSFEEFKLFYESTEKVTDRRLEANRWNYSICLAIIIANAFIVNWALEKVDYFYVGITVALVLCAMAVLFCSLWMGQIRDFKSLNNAKFAVLNQMAPQVEFVPESPDFIVSFCPFEKEWQSLQKSKAAQEVFQNKIIALKSSNIEYFIPKAFMALFSMAIGIILLAIVFNWFLFLSSWMMLFKTSSKPILP
jgi:hypothetical protein